MSEIVSFFFTLLFLSSCAPNDNSQKAESLSVKRFILNTEDPSTNAIRLSNTGSKSAHFKMKVNGNIYFNLQDILEAIKKMPVEYPGEPLHRKAWRYVINTTTRAPPLTIERWQHNPVLFLNSLGFGYCDDKASVLSFIWTELGY